MGEKKEIKIKRRVWKYEIQISGRAVIWEIRETRTNRFYVYNHDKVNIAWSFSKEYAQRKMNTILKDCGLTYKALGVSTAILEVPRRPRHKDDPRWRKVLVIDDEGIGYE